MSDVSQWHLQITFKSKFRESLLINPAWFVWSRANQPVTHGPLCQMFIWHDRKRAAIYQAWQKLKCYVFFLALANDTRLFALKHRRSSVATGKCKSQTRGYDTGGLEYVSTAAVQELLARLMKQDRKWPLMKIQRGWNGSFPGGGGRKI